MKILVIQTSQLADLLLTLPTLSAIKRANPEARLDLLVRAELQELAEQAKCVDRVIIEDSLVDLASLIGEQYSVALNLSFSRSSAEITSAVEAGGAVSFGYSQFSDGTIKISDDASSYFHAQVGGTKSNRFHLVDLFASVCSVDLTEDDFSPAHLFQGQVAPKGNQLLIQIGGASLSPRKLRQWKKSLQRLATYQTGPVIFVGGSSEREIVSHLVGFVKSKRFINKAGELSAVELLDLVNASACLISGDSLLSAMGTVTGTRCLELSKIEKSGWETGPISPGSCVIQSEDPKVTDDEVASEILMFVKRSALPKRGLQIAKEFPGKEHLRYSATEEMDTIEWSLIKALYLPFDFPRIEEPVFQTAVQKIFEANALAIEQIELLSAENAPALAPVVALFDDVIQAVQSMCPQVQPLNDWFRSERLRIPPGRPDGIKAMTLEAHNRFSMVCSALIELGKTKRSVDRGSNKDRDVQL